MAENINIPATNETSSQDKPITGGETTVVVNKIYVRQAQRQSADIGDYKDTIKLAESSTNPRFAPLFDIITHYLLDGHLIGIIEKRINTVLNKDLYCYDDNDQPIPEMKKLIASNEFRKAVRTMLETKLWSRSGIEALPGSTFRIKSIPRKHIDLKNQRILYDQNGREGIDYTVLDNVYIMGDPGDLGLLVNAVMYAIYKANALADWSQFIEIYGMPSRVGYYDPQNPSERDTLEQIFDTAGSNTDLVAPNTAKIEIQDGKSSNGNGDLQMQFVQYCDDQMSICLLGNVETTNGGGGSLAKSKVQQQQQNQITKSDLAYVEALLNEPHFIKILASYGYPVDKGCRFEYRKELDVAELKLRAEVDQILKGMGTKIPESYIQDTYGIPEQDGTEPLVGDNQEDGTDPEDPEEQAPVKTPAAPKKAAAAKKTAPKKKAQPKDLSDNAIDYDRIINGVAAKLKDGFFE